MLIQKEIFLNEKCKYKGHLFTSLQTSLKSDIIGTSGFPCLPSHCLLWCVVLLGGDVGEKDAYSEDASQEISGSATFKEGRNPFPNYWI